MNLEQALDILNIKQDATAEQAHKAYKLLAKKYHPDHNDENYDTTIKMQEINEAYRFFNDYLAHNHNQSKPQNTQPEQTKNNSEPTFDPSQIKNPAFIKPLSDSWDLYLKSKKEWMDFAKNVNKPNYDKVKELETKLAAARFIFQKSQSIDSENLIKELQKELKIAEFNYKLSNANVLMLKDITQRNLSLFEDMMKIVNTSNTRA